MVYTYNKKHFRKNLKGFDTYLFYLEKILKKRSGTKECRDSETVLLMTLLFVKQLFEQNIFFKTVKIKKKLIWKKAYIHTTVYTGK